MREFATSMWDLSHCGRMTSAVSIRCAPVNVARFRFLTVFLDCATSCTPVVAKSVGKSRFGGMK